MKVVVTGGAGFIGSHVVDRLRAAGAAPVVLDVRPSPRHAEAGVPQVRTDVLDLPSLTAALAGADVVVHLAAVADVADALADPARAALVNAQGTANVLEAARRAGVGRAVYGSTIWVYPDAGPRREVDEDSPLAAPSHPYAASKLAGELYCASYAAVYGLSTTVLRFGIPYGPRARPAAVIPRFVARALAGAPLELAGGGAQSRRFVYVEDLAWGVAAAALHPPPSPVLNLPGAVDTTIREVAEVVAELVGDVQVVLAPGRTGDFGGAAVSGARAARELGWRAETPLREGIARYLAWVRQEGAARAGLTVAA